MKKVFLLMFMVMACLDPRAAWGDANREPELSSDFLKLVIQELYRWHLDETALLVVDDATDLKFWYRSLHPQLDEGDRSQFIELLLPQLQFLLVLKKSDYAVPELGVDIRNADFRIYRVEKTDKAPVRLESHRQVILDKQAVISHLFAMRSQREFPDEELIERMRTALRDQYAHLVAERIEGPQTIYVAPISSISNDLWVFWENARRIIRFSSDSDMNTPAFWEFEKLGVRMYDLEKNVVVSLAEAAGSNAYVTRDWAARVLFNCIVLGQRQTIFPRHE